MDSDFDFDASPRTIGPVRQLKLDQTRQRLAEFFGLSRTTRFEVGECIEVADQVSDALHAYPTIAG